MSPDLAMPDIAAREAVTPDAAADQVLDRLKRLYPVLIDLSLGRLEALLARLGHPERALPPVIHVAGTNGKGSTCASIRAIAEAAGLAAHVTTSPHLVSITERFRVRGTLVGLPALVAVLEEIERVNGDAPITVFEAIIAAALMLFARTPADLAIVEVGLGGRFDATNVVHPAVSAITSISMDHEAFLGATLEAIAGEKAGIIKPGVPVVTGRQHPVALAVIAEAAARQGAPLLARDRDWEIGHAGPAGRLPGPGAGLVYRDAAGSLSLPFPSLRGEHQIDNAGIAIAALRRSGLPVPAAACAAIAAVSWPARLQRLEGALAARLPAGAELWLDGGHNPAAGEALAASIAGWSDRPLHLIVGMKETKDAHGFLAPLLPLAASVSAIREPGVEFAMATDAIVAASGGRARPGPDLDGAIAALSGQPPGRVVICGSLYLAGEVLRRDGYRPR